MLRSTEAVAKRFTFGQSRRNQKTIMAMIEATHVNRAKSATALPPDSLLRRVGRSACFAPGTRADGLGQRDLSQLVKPDFTDPARRTS